MKPSSFVFKDPNNTTAEILTQPDGFEKLDSEIKIKAVTYPEVDGMPILSSAVLADFNTPSSSSPFKIYRSAEIAENTLFSADSMTKIVTAAAILRMSEKPEYHDFLPAGIKTTLSHLLPLLKETYRGSDYIQNELEHQPNFENITLQHLAQHTSGLTPIKREALNKLFRDAGRKLTPEEIIDAEKVPTDPNSHQIGQYFYNNLAYELLGRIITAIDCRQKGHERGFGEIINELVIDRVKEKTHHEQARNLKFFTSDQTEIIDGAVQIIGHPEFTIEFGRIYHDGAMQPTPSCLFDISCGGSYTNPESMAVVAFHTLHSDASLSIFENKNTLDIFNSEMVTIPDQANSGVEKAYGLGYESYTREDYRRYRSHGGLGYGSNSNVLIDTQENKAATVMMSYENLIPSIAFALINGQRATAPISLNPPLYEKCLDLSRKYSEGQLIEFRQELEKSYEAFREKFDNFHKAERDERPSSELEIASAEKIAGEEHQK